MSKHLKALTQHQISLINKVESPRLPAMSFPYQQPPTFADFMGEEQITIELDVSGAAAFDFELWSNEKETVESIQKCFTNNQMQPLQLPLLHQPPWTNLFGL